MQPTSEVDGPDGEDEFLGAFRSWAIDEKGWRPKTLTDYSQRVRAAARSIGLQVLNQADSAALKKYLYGTKPSARNRNSIRCALVAWFDFLVAAGARSDNPARALPRLPERRLLPKPINAGTAIALLRAAERVGPMLYCLVCFYLFTGLRLSEVRWLRWPQVGPVVTLAQKGGDERVVYLHAELLRALEKWRVNAPSSEWVFPSPVTSWPIGGNWIERKVKELGQAVGVPNITPHRLRHTFGTQLYRQTRDVLLVRRAMGHASLQSTMIYVELAGDDVQRAVEQLRFDV